ncbi:MAG: SigE family RNA polymerase sigma factor [Actinobacteria bacterium]|nr:SigE family RNA polymerase sigma factor [Actinomycetota bacterium]
MTQARPQVAEAFEAFFEKHHAELSRLAFLVTGSSGTADEVAADALLATWTQWDRVCAADSPIAYVRRMVVNIGTSRVRRTIHERRLLPMMVADDDEDAPDLTTADVLDVREALRALPPRRRACIVLRYGLDLSEEEVARTLEISPGTVKSQTSKAAAQLRGLLGGRPRCATTTGGT